MGFTKVFFATVFAALLCVEATPHTHATHRKREIRGKSIDTFHPASELTTYGEGQPIPNAQSFAQPEGLQSNVMRSVANILQVDISSLEWTSGFTADDTGISVGYVKQVHDGVAFANAVANVAFADNKVIGLGNSFVNFNKISSSTPTVSREDAILAAEWRLGALHNGIPTLLQYLARPDGSAALVHAIQMQNDTEGTFYEAYVDAHSGELVSVVDFVVHASFRVLPIENEIITQGLKLIKDPEDLTASPNGWNNDGTTATTDTTGNNAFVVKLINNGTIQEATNGTGRGADLTFDFTYDPKKDPTDPTNANAARVNGFYIVNTFHDILYKYGFTEKAFNFQANNFGKGGQGGDPIEMSVQDPSGTNNANFATPPDGQPGVCRMYLWDITKPRQDGSMENDIPVHELTHGVTNRMTGGGTARCLRMLESGGMGEGWSDAVADWMVQTSPTKDVVLGQYVLGNSSGIRSYPYSVNETVNPLKYSNIGKLQEVHEIGEVWANTLHNVYADLVTHFGFSHTAKTDPTGKEGNVVFMKLLITGLTIQPCNPTVLAARDAIIQADTTLFRGTHECTLRKSFAKKGLGLKATADFKDDFSVPPNCQ